MIHKLLKLGVVVALASLAAWGAFALDVNQNYTPAARQNSTQQTSYYRVTVNFNDPRISTAQMFGKLPKGSYLSSTSCHVITAFNAGTTNVLTIGTSTTATEIIGTADINEASATYQSVTTNLGTTVASAADVTLYAKYAQTGPAATTGKATCVIEFIPDNDL